MDEQGALNEAQLRTGLSRAKSPLELRTYVPAPLATAVLETYVAS